MSSLRHMISAAILGATGVLGTAILATAPAAAQERPAWEAACSYKQPSGTFGNGYGIVADACAHLRFCQSMADQGRDGTPMACFGFAPAARPSDKRL